MPTLGKESACNAGNPISIPESGRSPGEGNGCPLQYFFLKVSGQRSLVGYSPWGLKESDRTEQLNTAQQLVPRKLRRKHGNLVFSKDRKKVSMPGA